MVDPAGGAIAGAKILAGAAQTASGADGSFTIELEAGEHELRVSKDGFAETPVAVRIPAEASLVITLPVASASATDVQAPRPAIA